MDEGREAAYRPEVRTKPPWNRFRIRRASGSMRKLPYPRIEAEMLGTYIAVMPVRYLEAECARPFAMWVSFMEPHSPRWRFSAGRREAAAARGALMCAPRRPRKRPEF